MRVETTSYTLGDLVDLSQGLAVNAKTRHLISDYGTPLLRITDLINGTISQFVDAKKVPQQCVVAPEEIVYTRTGQVGLVFRGNRGVAHNNCFKVAPKPELIDSDYLYWFLSQESVREHANAIAAGSVQKDLNHTAFKSIPIELPCLQAQRSATPILNSIANKIELNCKMNTTLEAMARALFQSWFVDFDPVRAKLDGMEPVGMDKETAALWPDKFEDSDVGQIPKNWRLGSLDELTKFVIGGDWGATEATDEETVLCYCIRGADIPSLQSGGVGKMPTRYLKQSSVEKRRLADGDLVIEISGGSPTQSTGRPVLASEALLNNLGKPLVASNFCRIVKLKSPILSKFIYLWMKRLYDTGELFQFETGTTGIKNFAFALFTEKYPLVSPDLLVAEAFNKIVSPIFARIQANSNQSRTLATLRDTLLPKLLSGEMRVEAVSQT